MQKAPVCRKLTLMHVLQVALVGAPNVGKSSLVQSLSSGLPEICDYPFTTRTVKMGHFFVQGKRHQVQLPSCTGPSSEVRQWHARPFMLHLQTGIAMQVRLQISLHEGLVCPALALCLPTKVDAFLSCSMLATMQCHSNSCNDARVFVSDILVLHVGYLCIPAANLQTPNSESPLPVVC